MAASGVGLLSTIIAAPVAIGIQAGAIVCRLLGKFIGRWLQAEAKKNTIRSMACLSKLNLIADRILAALTDDKISDEEFRKILPEGKKYDQMKAGIRERQKRGLSEVEKRNL